ncbi:MAG: protein kinase [Piscinibacter sp.]|uniref:serine/threonine-protein kinase n=1 Tax=Piscinibacter sp. TaxID=1903157 RepID=UPI003D0E1F93
MSSHPTLAAERLFAELSGLEPTQRATRLAEACAGNEALREEVEALLDAAERGAAHFDGLRRRLGLDRLEPGPPTREPVSTDQFAPRRAVDALEATGSAVGPYRLIREIGSGGMGSVWLAERVDLLQGRQVALKLPHAVGAAWRRAGLAERLAREREILATLEHPHIARLYDAGLGATGQPYLALEYVQGEPIDRHAQARGLTVRQRIELFLQVCDAVAHAHARLVVHRDLKPGNILVDAEGQVKLLDFGIAKLMEGDAADATELTRELGQVLTPGYAAPEQIEGRPLGTAADVYSLGVVLYELLTGARPYAPGAGGRAALLHAVLQAEPRRPSEAAPDEATRRRLEGDIDTIVLKALKKAPQDRYASVAALADDLRRHLAHEPVLARPDGAAYRARKFAQRHRAAVVAASAALLSLTAGLGIAAWQAVEARAQRDAALRAKALADEQAAAARAAERVAVAEADLSSFLVSDLTAERDGADMLAQLDRALTMVRAQYALQPELRGRMLLSLAQNYRWVSLHERADALFAEAEPLLQAAGQQAALAQLTCIRGTSLARAGALTEARARLASGTAMAMQAGEAAIGAQIECLIESAWTERYASAPRRAAELVGQALALVQRTGRGNSELASEALNQLSRAQFESGQFRAAAESAQRSIEMLQRIGREHTPGLRNAWGMRAKSLREGGQPLQALVAHGAEGRFEPAGPDLPTPMREDYAVTLLRLGRFAEARALADDVRRQTRAQGDPNMERFAAITQLRTAAALGRREDVRRLKTEALALFAPLARASSLRMRALHLAELDAALDLGQAEAAQGALAAARGVLDRLGDPASPQWLDLHRGEARLALLRHDPGAALRALEPALAIAQAQSIDAQASLLMAEVLLLRAQAHRANGDLSASRADAAAAQRHATTSAGPAHPMARLAQSLGT